MKFFTFIFLLVGLLKVSAQSTNLYVGQDLSIGSALTTTIYVGGGSSDITNGLIAWYKFDEGSGTTASDSSGSGHNGTLTSSPTWITGPSGNGALNFTSTSQNVSCGTINGTALTEITITFWLKVSSTANESKIVDWGNIYIKCSNGGGQTVNGTVSGSAAGSAYTSQTVFDSTWHFIAYTSSGSSQTIYFDGAASGTASQTFTPQNTALYVAHILTASVDDVRIYNRSLSSTEISTLFSNGAQ
jgi:hypothetical protein